MRLFSLSLQALALGLLSTLVVATNVPLADGQSKKKNQPFKSSGHRICYNPEGLGVLYAPDPLRDSLGITRKFHFEYESLTPDAIHHKAWSVTVDVHRTDGSQIQNVAHYLTADTPGMTNNFFRLSPSALLTPGEIWNSQNSIPQNVSLTLQVTQTPKMVNHKKPPLSAAVTTVTCTFIAPIPFGIMV